MKLKRQLKLQMQRYHEELYVQSLHNCFLQQQQHPQQGRIPHLPPHHATTPHLYNHMPPPPPPPQSRQTPPTNANYPPQPSIRNCYRQTREAHRPMPYLKPSVSPHAHDATGNKLIKRECTQASCRCRHHSVEIN